MKRAPTLPPLVLLLLLPINAGCPPAPGEDAGPTPAADGGPDGGPDAGPEIEPEPEPENEGAIVALLADEPLAPAAGDGTDLGWPDAADLGRVEYVPNQDSATIFLPVIDGAVDFRAFILTDELALETPDGTERVLNTAVFCAGYRQHNDIYSGSRELLRRLDIADITGPVRVVIEALDTACPYAGALGKAHADIDVVNTGLPPEELISFSVYTEAETAERYGSVVFNGHRKSADLAQPADDVPPTVLARTTVLIDPNPNADPTPTSLVFAGFDDDTDAPVLIGDLEALPRSQQAKLFQNSEWSFYTYGSDHSQFFVDRGRLHTVLADWHQDIFATNVAYPKRPAQVDETDYVHATFEVASNATQRRYWWFFLCGAENPGETIDVDGKLQGDIIQTSFFYQPDGRNPSLEGWNCVQVFPRDGWPSDLGPTAGRPQSDIRVMVNVAGAAERESVINVSPDQYDCCSLSPGWFRQMDANGNLTEPMLDDQMLIAPRTRYDVWIRRDRVVLYVDGKQRLCNDFPDVALTMAEAAVGFGQVLYHSAAERVEFFRDYNDRTGQQYYIDNGAFIDERTWDNMGYDELQAAPADFDESLCFTF